jgi:glycosyltransferase involved in cell wall biosynthesis
MKEKAIELSILIPTKNEELTVGLFLDWAFEGLEKLGIVGEVVIADSSTDKTKEIAEGRGARVVEVKENGLGNAYSVARHEVLGKFVILGDADCTYDFRELEKFYFELKNGSEFVMGSRMKGEIQKKAMPFHHRYFGNPLTTFVLTKLLKLKFSDIHCGMRAMTRELLLRLPFNENGWEYAPEMIIEASKIAKRTSEVPIKFYKEPNHRLSHFKRGRFSFLAPFSAGLGSLRVTFLHATEVLLKFIGIFSIISGLAGTIVLIPGPIQINAFKFSNLTQGVSIVILNYGILCYMVSHFLKLLDKEDIEQIRRLKNKLDFNSIFLTLLTTIGISLIYVVFLINKVFKSKDIFLSNLELYLRYGNILLLFTHLSFTLFVFCLLINNLERKIHIRKVNR